MSSSRSGIIRQAIGPVSSRLLTHINNLEAILKLPIPADCASCITCEDDLTELQGKIKTCVDTLEKRDEQWQDLVFQIDDTTERTNEEKLYKEAAFERSGGYLNTVNAAKEATCSIERRIKELRRVSNSPPNNHNVHSSGPNRSTTSAKLPKLTLPTFGGDPLEWSKFWTIFRTNIHERDLAATEKFAYLCGLLVGPALSCIDGLSMTDANYDVALSILKDIYERSPVQLVSALYSSLKRMPTASGRIDDLQKTYDGCEKIFRQLIDAGERIDENKSLVLEVLSKYPSELVKHLMDHEYLGASSTLKDVRDALNAHIKRSESRESVLEDLQPFGLKQQRSPEKTLVRLPKSENASATSAFLSSDRSKRNAPENPCYFCSGNHFNSRCPEFTTAEHRQQRLRDTKRWSKCLSSKHVEAACTYPDSRLRCFFCKTTGHVSPLCPREFSKSDNTLISHTARTSTNDDISTTQALLNSSDEQSTLMTASTVLYNDDSGCKVVARVLFDTGSHRSYISEKCAARLRLKSNNEESLSVSVFGTNRVLSVSAREVQFGLQLRDGTLKIINAHTAPLIANCSVVPVNLQRPDIAAIRALKCEIADESMSSGAIDVLIGSDYFWEFIEGSKHTLPSGLFLIPSTVGALIGGRHSTLSFKDSSSKVTLLCLTETFRTAPSEPALLTSASQYSKKSPDLGDFSNLEVIGIRENPIVKDDDIALQQFNDNICLENGRYSVRWPWKDNMPLLPRNYELAFGRLKSLGKRLHGHSNVLQAYADVIEHQMKMGIIEKVPPKPPLHSDKRVHYLPHHPVVKPSSTTTKVRIVYDASSKTRKDNPSLNEYMLRGPSLLPELIAILLRFRSSSIALVSDIEKAFLQLTLQECDRDVTRFLWFTDPNDTTRIHDNVTEYRFCRVPFGIISSPFLLNATIHYHLNQSNSDVADKIKSNIYVDNVICGTETVPDAIYFYREAKKVFRMAGMNLQQWGSNSDEALHAIPSNDRVKETELKVLGLLWNVEDDSLRIQGSTETGNTKRSILHAIASFYDPLGLLQPALLRAKLFLKKLWDDNKSWDDELDVNYMSEWEQIRTNFLSAAELHIPRCPCPVLADSEVSIVTFCDASIHSYAAVVYLRVRSKTDSWVTSLVFSKSRLTPQARTHKISLPRLELLGVLIGARASCFAKNAIHTSRHIPVHIFTDSQCVLHWLKTPKPLSVFVTIRIQEINAHHFEMLYVKTSENPADFSTRGKSVHELNVPFWWEGPAWLKENSERWPSLVDPAPCDGSASSEYKSMPQVFHTVMAVQNDDIVQHPLTIDPARYSSFNRLLRITARCLKFLKLMVWDKTRLSRDHVSICIASIFQNVTHGPSICTNDINAARRVWLLHMQNSHFKEVKSALHIGKDHELVRKFGLYIDNDGILRCEGRLQNADWPHDTIRPILLSKKGHITELIIRDVHERLMHSGVSHTLCQIRKTYWVPQGRSAVRSVICRCPLCQKYKGAPYALPKMPPFPKERVSKSSPFQFTGLDYLGPISVRVEGSMKKMWICLFTCLAIRAIHLELVTDCSSIAFLQCIIRFVSRIGTPEEIISDNAPQFRVTKTVFDRVWHEILSDDSIQAYAATNGIRWKFTTELAPWQGGFYERLVGIVKGTMRSTIGRRLLSWEELLTITTEVEAIVNTRPITYTYSDFPSGRCLRPVDFITDMPVGLPVTDPATRLSGIGDAGKNVIRLWKLKQGRLKSMWEFWLDEYLPSLRERCQQHHRGTRSQVKSFPVVGDVLLVKDTDLPRGSWKLCRVMRVTRGSDNAVRSAEVRLPNGATIKRPINHLFPLEMGTCNNPSSMRGVTIRAPCVKFLLRLRQVKWNLKTMTLRASQKLK